jgi:RNA methyltransferase, TrmH family
MQVRELTSSSNALLKVFRRALADGVTREGWLAVEGPRSVEEALKARGSGSAVSIHSVLVSRSGAERFKSMLAQLPHEAEIAQVADRLFQNAAQTQTPQGIAALVELPQPDLQRVLAHRNPLLLVACGVQDPGNLGAIMRSAEALGATALVTLRGTVSPFNPKTIRSCAGSVFQLPVLAGQGAGALFESLRAAGVTIVATDCHSSSELAQADLRGSLALLVGNEASGLAAEIAAHATLRLSIPIRPGTDSVNVAAAAAIFLYEAARQREFRYSVIESVFH